MYTWNKIKNNDKNGVFRLTWTPAERVAAFWINFCQIGSLLSFIRKMQIKSLESWWNFKRDILHSNRLIFNCSVHNDIVHDTGSMWPRCCITVLGFFLNEKKIIYQEFTTDISLTKDFDVREEPHTKRHLWQRFSLGSVLVRGFAESFRKIWASRESPVLCVASSGLQRQFYKCQGCVSAWGTATHQTLQGLSPMASTVL